MVLSAGTHGSIKGYRYPVTKLELENAVNKVIENDPNIQRDKSDTTGKIYYNYEGLKNQYYYIDGKSYYNDGKNYLTIKIKSGADEHQYILRYYGSEEHWKTSTSSEIFICYAYDKNGKGGSQGQNSFKFKGQLKKELVNVFEREFVNKLDKELNLIHNAIE